jgi:hypothetical protein
VVPAVVFLSILPQALVQDSRDVSVLVAARMVSVWRVLHRHSAFEDFVIFNPRPLFTRALEPIVVLLFNVRALPPMLAVAPKDVSWVRRISVELASFAVTALSAFLNFLQRLAPDTRVVPWHAVVQVAIVSRHQR